MERNFFLFAFGRVYFWLLLLFFMYVNLIYSPLEAPYTWGFALGHYLGIVLWSFVFVIPHYFIKRHKEKKREKEKGR